MVVMIEENDPTEQVNNKSFTLSFRRAWIFGLLFLLVYLVVFFIFINNPNLDYLLTSVMITLLYSAVTVTLYFATKSIDPSKKRVKAGWALIMLAVLTSVLGNIFWAASVLSNQNPTSSISEIFYLFFYPLFLGGIILFPSTYKNPLQRFKQYFDILIIMFSISLLFWIFLIAPGLENFNGDIKSLLIMLIYVMGGLALIFAMLDLLFNRLKEEIYAPIILLLAGIFVLLITSCIYVYQFVHGSYLSGNPADFGWLIGYLFIGLAGVSQFNHQRINLDLLFEFTSNIYKNYSLTPYIALTGVSLGYMSLIWAYNTYNPNLTFLEFGIGVMIVLVVARQFISIRENKNLYWKAQNEIVLRKEISKSLKDSELAYRTIFENTGTATVIIGEDDIISLANTEFERLSGYTKNEIEGNKSWKDFVFIDDLDLMNETNQVRITKNEPNPKNYEFKFVNKAGNLKNVYVAAVLIPNSKDSLISLLDITDRKNAEYEIKRSLQEKETLLMEIHHRVKNNLTVISSLLNLQSRYIKDKDDLIMFKESQSRAKSMAIIHQRLYSSSDLKHIDFGDYIKTLAGDIFDSYVYDPGNIKLNFDVEDVKLDINTSIPLGLILNELLTNSLKYAFPYGESMVHEGIINIKLHKNDGGYTLIVEDNGVGLPEDFNLENNNSLGLQLINTLTNQIDGNLTCSNNDGVTFRIDFKDKEYS